MRLPPLDVSSTWPAPNYVDPQSHGPGLLAVQLTLLPVVLVCAALRVHARKRIKTQTLGTDDWLMILAVIFTTGLAVLIILANGRYGWNLHMWDQTSDQLVESAKADIAGQTVFLVADALAKLSILASYLRMTPRKSWFQRGTVGTMIIVGGSVLALEVVVWTQCMPASSYWTLLAPSTDCAAAAPPLLAQTIISALTSVMILVLPIHDLSLLPLPPSQRLLLLFIFALGLLSIAAACVRAFYANSAVTSPSGDSSWWTFTAWIWAIAQLNLTLLAGNLPLLRPIFTCELLHPVEERSYWPGTPRRGRSLSRSRRKHERDLEAGIVTVQDNRPWRKGSRETIFTLETLTVSRESSTASSGRTTAEGHSRKGSDESVTVVGRDSHDTHGRRSTKAEQSSDTQRTTRLAADRDRDRDIYVGRGDVRRSPRVSAFESEVHGAPGVAGERVRYSVGTDSESGNSAVLELGRDLTMTVVERPRVRMSRMEIEDGVRNFGKFLRVNSPLTESFERGLDEGVVGTAW